MTATAAIIRDLINADRTDVDRTDGPATTTDIGTAVIRCATTMLMTERRPIHEITDFLTAMATGPTWDGTPR